MKDICNPVTDLSVTGLHVNGSAIKIEKNYHAVDGLLHLLLEL